MSLSPARQHRLRVQAEQVAREGGSVRHASGYDLMLLQLAEDRRRLKGVQSTVKKAEIKVELLPKYAAWAEGVLAAGGAQQDDVLMYVMLWRIDAGDYAGALEICLLYTSDAADDLLCVDIGGRRIVKKKKDSNAGE